MNQGALPRNERVGKGTEVKAMRGVKSILHRLEERKSIIKRTPAQREKILVPKGGNLVLRRETQVPRKKLA